MATSSIHSLFKLRELSTARIRELTYLCWGALLAAFVLPMCIVEAGMHHLPDADFVRFYSLGKLLNEHPASELYDYELQHRISVAVHPTIGVAPMPHPPFVGMAFRVMAWFPYWVAYLAWVAITIALYASGLKMTVARFFPVDRERRGLAYALAFAFFPFIGFTVINGQISAIAFWGTAYAMLLDDEDRRFASGLALAMCLFKPSFFVLLVPMLLVSRRFRTLAGLATGGLMLVLLTTAVEGPGVWPVFAKAMIGFGSGSFGNRKFMRFSLYTDLKSLSMMSDWWAGWRGSLGLAVCTCVVGFFLVQLWWKSAGHDKGLNALVWATTVSWTLVLNVYVPIYDTILVVLSAIITAGALRRFPSGSLDRWFAICCTLVMATSWFTVELAARTGVQVLTPALIGFGVVEIVLAMRIGGRHGSERLQTAE